MEFDYGLWLGPSSLRCETGRQLGEENVWPTLFRRHIPTEYNVTKMRGSRNGLLVNMTALHLVMRAWPKAVELMESLRDAYVSLQPEPMPVLSQHDLFILSKAGCGLPAYMVRSRPQRASDGQLPEVVGTQFKLIAGFFMTVQHNLWGRDGGQLAFESAEAFFDYADRHEIFTSPGGRACGGSQRKIMALYDHLTPVRESPFLEPLASLADVPKLLAYVAHSLHLELTLLFVQRHLKAMYLEADGERTFDARNRREQIEWLRDTHHIEHTLRRLETMLIALPIESGVAEEFRNEILNSAQSLRPGAGLRDHFRAMTEIVQRHGHTCQSNILGLLGRSPLRALPRAQVERRLDLSSLVMRQ
ncbi:MAG: hypothetical protein AAFN07_08695 [Pseudomonadota bacterium]